MTRRTKLPVIVYLPASATLTSGEVRKAVGDISRAGLQFWRDHHQFPRFYGRNNQTVYDTNQVAAWLTDHGCEIKWN